jgi:uncharacterized protein (DUF488 family)
MLEEFIGLLQAHGATRVVDVPTVPRSLHNPQFNEASLPGSLKKAGLSYVHLPVRDTPRDISKTGTITPNTVRCVTAEDCQHGDLGTTLQPHVSFFCVSY